MNLFVLNDNTIHYSIIFANRNDSTKCVVNFFTKRIKCEIIFHRPNPDSRRTQTPNTGDPVASSAFTPTRVATVRTANVFRITRTAHPYSQALWTMTITLGVDKIPSDDHYAPTLYLVSNTSGKVGNSDQGSNVKAVNYMWLN